jgi:hypothetical protein
MSGHPPSRQGFNDSSRYAKGLEFHTRSCSPNENFSRFLAWHRGFEPREEHLTLEVHDPPSLCVNWAHGRSGDTACLGDLASGVSAQKAVIFII